MRTDRPKQCKDEFFSADGEMFLKFHKITSMFVINKKSVCKLEDAGEEPPELAIMDRRLADQLDGPMGVIANCVERIFNTPVLPPSARYDLLALYSWISEDAPKFSALLSSPLWSGIAFHALGIAGDTRCLNIREKVAEAVGWDTEDTGFEPLIS